LGDIAVTSASGFSLSTQLTISFNPAPPSAALVAGWSDHGLTQRE